MVLPLRNSPQQELSSKLNPRIFWGKCQTAQAKTAPGTQLSGDSPGLDPAINQITSVAVA